MTQIDDSYFEPVDDSCFDTVEDSYFDAIVIGAGNAGLTAATALQRGGAKTLLLERHNIPGGCATSFVRGQFEFEVALHQLSGMGTEEQPFVLRQMFEQLGIMDKLEVVEEKELYRIVLPGELDVTLPADWGEIQKLLIETYPDEAEAIHRFMILAETITIEAFMAFPHAQKQLNTELLHSSCPNYVKYGLVPAKQVLDEFFQDQDLKTVLAAYWCYIGMPTKDLPFVDLAMMIYAYAAFKPCHVRGGSQAISSALLESFQQAGGQVRFNCGAHKILTKNGKVIGVSAEDGQEYRTATVVSNTSPIHTYNELLDTDNPLPTVAEDMKSRRLGTSAFVLYVGLDCSPQDIGVTAASNFIIDERDEEHAFEAMKSLAPPPNIMMTCYNHDDPSFAPPGKSALSILCLQYGQPWESVPPRDYAQTKYQFAQHLLDQAERVFPGIREHIEEIEAATPLTMMRYLNTPGGAIYGFDQNIQDGPLFRERMDAIKGLYLAGCWNGMGGFQPTYMAGESTARAVLKHLQQIEPQIAHEEAAENA
ncbi:NAD(P)/FAD-dependent oxidoreductase [Pseudomaricurvus alkylphenolicus]|uniref:phytoene desaturase family protein n=1 Tax=Pseudomaricurvus alkylphenolicus TaxID=1306991 RepID=UPI0014204240|nr:NAD(P)/FAD-dependent oxidoreductase [Pseudomaricurvus alkylphenolicus]NIB41025.1 NAD(P)/FAD-dependent oxidoreductase [Pseudomaricurvus alkylphenolicus]